MIWTKSSFWSRKESLLPLTLLISACLSVLPLGQTCTVEDGNFLQVMQLEEELTIGTVIGSLHLDKPAEVSKLEVSEFNPYIDLVTRDSNGSMSADFVISERIDVDTGLNRLQTMYIECTTQQRLKLEIEMEFEIEDVNDHSPVFTLSSGYNFTISERAAPGAYVGAVMAKDGDIKNSHVSYELAADPLIHEIFELRTMTGGKSAIYTLSPLDYETKKEYTFTVLAKDCQTRRNCGNKQQTSVASVTVNIKNEDDLRPKFNQYNYRVSLSQEVKMGDLVVQVTAYDQDDFNEPIEYFLYGDGSEYFHIDKATGKVTVLDTSKLDLGTTFLFQVQAQQLSDPGMKDVTTLIITIVSTDWDKPEFTKRSYATSVSEYTKLNSTILSMAINYNPQSDPVVVKVVDSASDDGGSSYFATTHRGNNVDLRLVKSLDYEHKTIHRVTVVASNGKHSDAVEVTVNVLNENDNNPLFDKDSYTFNTFYVEQGIVGSVSASDPDDVNEDVLYKILHSDVSELFAINKNGIISLAGQKGLYTRDSYTLIIEAVDSGLPPRTANIVVTINLQLSVEVKAASVKSSAESLSSPLTYGIIGSAVVVVIIVVIGVVCFVYHRKVSQHKKRRRQAEENNKKQIDGQAFIPLCVDHHSNTLHSRQGNTYTDMLDLNDDENYRLMWASEVHSTRSGMTGVHTLTSPRTPHAGSDSGRSSCTHQHSHSDCGSRLINSTSAALRHGNTHKYLQEQARQHSTGGRDLDNSYLVQALPPPAFRSPNMNRRASVSGSTYSDYAGSVTSDYGSNTVSSEVHCKLMNEDMDNHNASNLQSDVQSKVGTSSAANSPTHSETDNELLTQHHSATNFKDQPADVIVINSKPAAKVVTANQLNEVNIKRSLSTFQGDAV